MIKKITPILVLCFSLSLSVDCLAIHYKGFYGGMFLHTGYINGKSFSLPNGKTDCVVGMPIGIGGRGACMFSENFRMGIEGYATTTDYNNYGSYYRIGWGGILNEFYYPIGRLTPFVGVTIGGGATQHLIMMEPATNDFVAKESILRHYSLFIINPSIGLDIALNPRMQLSFKVDYMLSPMNKEPDFATGIRLYIGITFIRRK